VPEIEVSVQAEPTDLESWLALARRVEAAGFSGLVMGDHPGSGAAPWPALGAAAAVTRTLRLGTRVAQAGVREPMHVAADAASLSVLAPGRVVLGIGAGHTPREWQDLGQDRPAARDRAGRLAEFVEVVARLLRGETVTRDGRYLSLRDSRLEGFPADAGRVAITVGGGHPEILRSGARHADVISLSGLGATLADGHHHEARWSAADLHRQLDLIRAEAQRAGTSPVIEALVQRVTITADRAAAAGEISRLVPGPSAQDVAQSPFTLLGTHEQIAGQLRRQAATLGITSYVVREPAVPDLERVLALLRE
jgi:probable F420-dependent oxidoreductase